MDILYFILDITYITPIVIILLLWKKLEPLARNLILMVLLSYYLTENIHLLNSKFKLDLANEIVFVAEAWSVIVFIPFMIRAINIYHLNKWIFAIIDLVILFFISLILFNNSTESVVPIFSFVNQILILSTAMLFFWKTLNTLKIPSPQRSGLFWFFSAMLYYHGAVLFNDLCHNFIFNSKELYYAVWPLRLANIYILNILLLTGVLVPLFTKKSTIITD